MDKDFWEQIRTRSRSSTKRTITEARNGEQHSKQLYKTTKPHRLTTILWWLQELIQQPAWWTAERRQAATAWLQLQQWGPTPMSTTETLCHRGDIWTGEPLNTGHASQVDIAIADINQWTCESTESREKRTRLSCCLSFQHLYNPLQWVGLSWCTLSSKPAMSVRNASGGKGVECPVW